MAENAPMTKAIAPHRRTMWAVLDLDGAIIAVDCSPQDAVEAASMHVGRSIIDIGRAGYSLRQVTVDITIPPG